MSWLNLNQSLNSLKGQITSFATEVLSEGVEPDTPEDAAVSNEGFQDLQEKCHNQELQIAALKKLNEELEASLQAEKLSRKNGLRDEESNWYWDPPTQDSKPIDDIEKYKKNIQALQQELSALKERDVADFREEEINRLKDENKNLTNNLEELDSQNQQAMDRLLALKKELQKNFEVLKQDHEDLKFTNDEYSDEIRTLQEKLSEKDKQCKSLTTAKEDYETLHHKYQNLERVHTLLRENAEKFQEENQELHEENFKLQEQVTKLEHEVEMAVKHSELSNSVPRERYDEVLKELNDMKHRKNSNQLHLDEVNIDDNAKSVIENLKREIIELKHKLDHKDTSLLNSGDSKLFVKSDKLMHLYNKYVNFELPVDYVGEIPLGDDNIVLHKIEGALKTLYSFKKDKDTLEHNISDKKHQISHMQTQIDDLTTENDYLTSDVQHYEKELGEMKKNNDFMISELSSLKNVTKLQPIIETHEDNIVKLETELADCNTVNQTFKSQIQRVEKELNEVKSEKVSLQKSLAEIKDKYTQMLTELEVCKTQTQEVTELEHIEQVSNLSKTEDVINDLKKTLNASKALNEKLAIDIRIIENDKILLTKKADDLKQSLEEKNTLQNESENAIFLLENKLKDIQNKLDEATKQKLEAEIEKTNLVETIKLLESRTVSSDSNCSDIAQIEKLSDENSIGLRNLNLTSLENATLNETVQKLTEEITYLKTKEQELINEINVLKNTSSIESEKIITSLQQTVKELNLKLASNESVSLELEDLKMKNQDLIEKKLQIESELISTDQKISKLEDEFEKLLGDLNEKDVIIDALNSTISQNNGTLGDLKQNVVDLENSVAIKNQEIEYLRHNLSETTEKLKNVTENSNIHQDEFERLVQERDTASQEIVMLQAQIQEKMSEIVDIRNGAEFLENTCKEYKENLVQKDKEMKELNQSMLEMTDKMRSKENRTQHNDDYAKLAQEKETIAKEMSVLKEQLMTKEKEIAEITNKTQQLEISCSDYVKANETATKEKAELINLINLKHNESIQYHNEIQRLNQVLLDQTNTFKELIEEKDSIINSKNDTCATCENLRITLKEKDEIIKALSQSSTDHDRIKAELAFTAETVKSLTEKCETLDKSLAIQLDIVKKLTAENLQLSEQESNSTRELARLRQHMMETEESYASELMAAEQKLADCQTRLHQVEERAKQTSTVYTSNSIRANQEVETYRNQIKLLEKQREEASARLSEADDARSRSQAALTNLQVVLEQFQNDKDREIEAATEKIRNKMADLKRQNGGLQDEVLRLNTKLQEATAGLQAATRLGDQLESKTVMINDLKEQVRTLQTSVTAAEERYYNAISNQQDRVDKNLVKNLVVNYVTTPSQNNRTQALRILSSVLDFNQRECTLAGLARGAPTDSLSRQFVHFLEQESRPERVATLPDMATLSANEPSSRRSSGLGPQPNPYELGHKRNLSTGSNNLLFQNTDNVETASQSQLSLDTSSVHSDHRVEPKLAVSMASSVLENAGINQVRNTEGAILKHVLMDM